MRNKVLVVTDNGFMYRGLVDIARKLGIGEYFSYRRSKYAENSKSNLGVEDLAPISVKKEVDHICSNYNLVISLHCKQLFPLELIQVVRCINVHPGLNPYNRGWYPQVFSLINGLPAGATIHEIDEELDHGQIIAQRKVAVLSHDTSGSLYNRVCKAELELLEENIVKIIKGEYDKYQPIGEGNVNYREDFSKLLEIDLHKMATYQNVINHLRALTFEGYKNAFYYDGSGKKIYIEIALKPED